jgi:hypothetical protein
MWWRDTLNPFIDIESGTSVPELLSKGRRLMATVEDKVDKALAQVGWAIGATLVGAAIYLTGLYLLESRAITFVGLVIVALGIFSGGVLVLLGQIVVVRQLYRRFMNKQD